ncbi:unnamed protein product, partial [Rotaria sp. Silwood2]
MDHFKRPLAVSQSPEGEKKKCRNEYNRSISCIEDLPNGFFYEAFDYLGGYAIYKAFANLNIRFQELLNSSSLLFKIELHNPTHDELFMNNYKSFLCLNKHKILSIKLWLRLDNDNFFSLFVINSSLSHLESIFVDGISTNTLIALLINLACLPQIFSLTLDAWSSSDKSNEIYRLIFALPKLKSIKLTLDEDDISITLPTATNKKSTTIEYLIIDHSCTLKELFIILSYTPELCRLKLSFLNQIDTTIHR